MQVKWESFFNIILELASIAILTFHKLIKIVLLELFSKNRKVSFMKWMYLIIRKENIAFIMSSCNRIVVDCFSK